MIVINVLMLMILTCLYLTGIGAAWPILLGGQAHWTVGLVAALMSISSIIAADTYAFLGGKVIGLVDFQHNLCCNMYPLYTNRNLHASLSSYVVSCI